MIKGLELQVPRLSNTNSPPIISRRHTELQMQLVAQKIIAEMSFSPEQERRSRDEKDRSLISFGERIDRVDGTRQDSYELLKDKNGFSWWHQTSNEE